jgi:hypothetical protein
VKLRRTVQTAGRPEVAIGRPLVYAVCGNPPGTSWTSRTGRVKRAAKPANPRARTESLNRSKTGITLTDCTGRSSHEISRRDHAAVTAGDYHRPRPAAERHVQLGMAGRLIIRVWQEGSSANPQLRIRIVGQQDLARDAQDTATASTIEDTPADVGDWPQRVATSG